MRPNCRRSITVIAPDQGYLLSTLAMHYEATSVRFIPSYDADVASQ